MRIAAVLGAAVAPTAGLGAMFGYFLDSNTILEFSVYSGQNTDDSFFWKRNLKADLYSFRVKKYFGNSFYVNGGLGYRKMSFDITKSDISETQYSAKTDTFGLDVAIGNNWQYKNFTIGTDWVGGIFPISKPKIIEDIVKDGVRDQNNNEIDKAKKNLTSYSLQLIRFIVVCLFNF